MTYNHIINNTMHLIFLHVCRVQTEIYLPVTDKLNYGSDNRKSYSISLLGDEHWAI